MSVCVCVSVCLSVCLCDRRRTQSLNQLPDLAQIRYIGSSCKYLEFFLVFPLPLKLRVIHIRKIFLNMALTIWLKFFRFIVHQRSTMTISALLSKFTEARNFLLIFCVTVASKPNDRSSNSAPRTLFANLKLKISKTIIRPAVTYGCDTWNLTCL